MSNPNIAIDGLGLVGAFGTGTDAFREALSVGYVEPEFLPVDPDGDDVTYPVLQAKPDGLTEFVTLRALRRIDLFSRLAILGAGLAMKDGRLDEFNMERVGIVIGAGYGASATTFGFMDSMLDFGDACASPTKFSNSVHNAAVSNTAITLNIEGPTSTVSQFGMSVPAALCIAIDWLRTGAADAIVLGGVDEYCRPLGYCYKRYFGETTNDRIRPLEFGKQTAIPGEGAAFLILRRAEDVDKPKAVICDLQLGFGAGNCEIPADSTLIIGADGHIDTARHYLEVVTDDQKVACHTPVYGSMPCAPAFDLAAACVELENSSSPVHCLTFNCRGDFGLISLQAGG